jgi:hypothetical protein
MVMLCSCLRYFFAKIEINHENTKRVLLFFLFSGINSHDTYGLPSVDYSDKKQALFCDSFQSTTLLS